MYRHRKGLSLTALADISGVSLPAIWKSEKGHTSPSITTLEKLAVALDVSVAEIVYAEEVLERRKAVEQVVNEFALTG